MSNGLYSELKKIIESGEIPTDVSNGIILAFLLENREHSNNNADNISILQTDVIVLKAADKKWGGLAMLVAAVSAFFKPGV